jgi:hypothetical protein
MDGDPRWGNHDEGNNPLVNDKKLFTARTTWFEESMNAPNKEH